MINRGRFQAFAQSGATYSAHAIDLVEGSLVIDMLSALGAERWEKMWHSANAVDASDFQWLKSSGISVFHLTGTTFGARAREYAFKEFARLNSLILYKSAHGMRIDSAADFERVKREGKAGFLLGMTVDISHCADRTTLEAIEASSKPVAVTHANCRALNPGYPRCKTDEAIRKMAAKGGVMGLTVLRAFVRSEEPTTEEMEWYGGLPSNAKKFYRFRTRIEIDGLDHPKRVYDIAEGLIRRGYSDADIRGVLGLNFKRMLEETWSRQKV